MSDTENPNFQERNQVSKRKKGIYRHEYLLVIAACIAMLIIGVSSFSSPSLKTSKPLDSEEKEDLTYPLNQNMDAIKKLQARQAIPHTGYQGGDPNHPPKLKTQSHKKGLTKEILARMNAPTTFYSSAESPVTVEKNQSKTHKTLMGNDANAEFLNQQNEIASVVAKQIPHPDLTVPAGELIPAILETAINSDLAGMVRAITSRDIYALSGDKLLIPKGSSLIGQFNAEVSQGQNRIFIVWNRVRLTNGVIVTLNSPNTDIIGRSGQAADYIDRHFFERFGSSVLLSVLGAYSALGGVNSQDEYNSKAQYRMMTANSFQQAANQTLQQDMQTKPTLQINQGTSINIFVARDLDFHHVAKRI